MAGGLNEVEASMDTVVYNLLAVDTVLLFEIRIKSRLDVLENGFPAEAMLVY